MNINKQRLTELLWQKDYWEKKKNWYNQQYQYWTGNSGLWTMALLGIASTGGENIRRGDPLSKALGWIFLGVAVLLCLRFVYKTFKTIPYERKVKICERKISAINYQITKELAE